MASEQIIAYGATVERSTDGVTYTNIPQCKGVAIPGVVQDYPEVTNLDSVDSFKEFIKGLKNIGEIPIPVGYTAAGYAQQLVDQAAATATYYRVTLRPQPSQSTGDAFLFRGFPTPTLVDNGLGEPIDMTLTIRGTGALTWVQGS